MNKFVFTSAVFLLLFLLSCSNNPQNVVEEQKRIVLRFELDSTGNIADTKVVDELSALAVSISRNADKVVMHSYTEQMPDAEEAKRLALERVMVAKAIMFQAAHERIYYSVGLDAAGFEKPLDTTHPGSLTNRRVEIEYLK